MKNLNDAEFQPQSPRPPRRRRMTNPAKAGVAVAGIAILALGLFALNADAQWAKPMPLRHKIVTTVSALQIPQGTREVVGLGNADPSHISIQTDTVYAGTPVEISTITDLPLVMHLPASATVIGPAGPVISFDQSQVGTSSELSWRASVPATAAPSVTAPPAGETFASWYVEFSAPGRYTIPVSIGSTVKTATIDVLPLPAGGRVHATMTPPASLRPQLSAINVGSTPLQVALNGQPVTLAPGATQTITPGLAYTVAVSAFSGGDLTVDIYQSHGHVTYSGTVTTHRTVTFRPHRPPFALPLWFWAALIAALLLLASTVAGLTGGRAGRGRGGKVQGAKSA